MSALLTGDEALTLAQQVATIGNVLGRPPAPFATWVQDHRADFEAPM
ncbi:hypothetical protein HPO96_35560 [Kribbella sandramycini]|uniref:Uncharacterized protein YbjT (DUF2867 family) n=1 Tax=Kribbella sandramycini TaxID=60450 RepID=A0A7Y4P3Y7_9ACTN|nr:hypothetical protein [Kribbella sandramycini]MBB6568804.1 uncharacterized protein YbjT (DUF2867 family) [Kribbella sandramycini]NOL45573.1 hypothetical protein [Kribbella sandramycini]